jgi:hypothetical protein
MSKVALISMGERTQDQISRYLRVWLNNSSAFNDVNVKPDENVMLKEKKNR